MPWRGGDVTGPLLSFDTTYKQVRLTLHPEGHACDTAIALGQSEVKTASQPVFFRLITSQSTQL